MIICSGSIYGEEMEVMKASEFIGLLNDLIGSIGGDPHVIIRQHVTINKNGRAIEVCEPACVKECTVDLLEIFDSGHIGYSTDDQKKDDAIFGGPGRKYTPIRVIEIF